MVKIFSYTSMNYRELITVIFLTDNDFQLLNNMNIAPLFAIEINVNEVNIRQNHIEY